MYFSKSFIVISLLASQALSFNNPVIDNQNVPDPGALNYQGQYYVVTTGGDGSGKFPIHRSSDLQNWEFVGMALHQDRLPSWVSGPNTDFWAPELHIVNGGHRLYFTARD